MKFHQLQYLVTIAEKGSVRAAAQILNLSPAAVSRGIIELEESLSTTLLVRQSIGVALTDQGKQLVVSSRQILARVEEASQSAQSSRQGETLSVEVTPWVVDSILPYVSERFSSKRPSVQLFLSEALGFGNDRLRDGSVDLAIGMSPPADVSEEFREHKLFSWQPTIICRKGHLLAGARSVTELSAASWVLTHNAIEHYATALRPLLQAALDDPRGSRVQIGRAPRLTSAIVEKTDRLTICPWPLAETDYFRERFDAMTLAELDDVRTTSMLTRRNVVYSGLARDFLQCVLEVSNEAFTNADPMLKRVFRSLDRLSS